MAGLLGGGLGDRDLSQNVIFRGFELILHLHGFNHQHALTGLNFGARSDKDSHHLTGHGGRNLFDAVSGGIGAAAGAKRSRIANGYAEGLPPDDDSRPASPALLPDVIRCTTALTTGLSGHQRP